MPNLEGGDHANAVFFEIVDDECVTVPDDPVGKEVVEIILDTIDASQ